ncbi:MAG: hypothetical protein FWE04_06710 [Oscillospiraceae bacterium]|nr:hypothetical protein [Oscillospiraceae bacterium]
MYYDHKFGKQIMEHKLGTGAVVGRIIGFSLVALLFIFILALMILDFLFASMTGSNLWIIYGFAIVGFNVAFWIVALIRFGRSMKATLYEFGLKHSRGKKVTEILFRDVKDMQDVTGRTRGVEYRRVAIIKSDDTKFVLNSLIVPKHKIFFAALKAQFLLNNDNNEKGS